MKKFLLVTAAAVLSSTIAANAGNTSGQPTVIQLNGLPDVFTITTLGAQFAQEHVRGLERSFGVGTSATTPSIYNGVSLSDFGNNGNYQAFYEFQYPFRTGGRWTAFASVDGIHVIPLGSGTYTVESQ